MFKFHDRLFQHSTVSIRTFMMIQLPGGRTGLRALISVETRDPQSAAGAPASPGDCAETPVLDFVASNDTLDRYREIIEPAGWRLDAYRRNPVFQNAHQYGDILFTLGKALITEVRSCSLSCSFAEESDNPTLHQSKYLFQRIQFATDVNPMARIAYGLYKGKFLNAVSVGFVPIRWETGAPDAAFRRRYLEAELLEVSAVAIPANPDALALGLKAGAVDRSDLRELADLLAGAIARLNTAAGAGADEAEAGRPAAQGAPIPVQHRDPGLVIFARELRRILRRA